MALNDTLKTRILLRNDTLAQWEDSSLVLGKGEIAIATGITGGLAEVRVGTGSSTWATSEKLKIDTAQVSGLTELIQSLVGNGAKKYKVVANGENGNSWKLQEAPLSATGDEWIDVTGSTAWTVDFSGLDYDGGSFGATKFVTKVTEADGVVAAEYAQPTISDISGLQTALDAKLDKTTFSTISNDIGLSAANSENPVITKKDIADLAGAMHFRGPVSNPSEITDPVAGDIVIIPSTSKEYVYDGTDWIELGDEVLYAKKSEVATISGELTSDIANITADVGYLSGQIDVTNAVLNTVSSDYLTSADKTELQTLIGTTSAETLVSAKAYTDEKIDALSIGDYATIEYVNGISSSLSTDYSGKIKAVDDKLADYALSADVTSEIAAAKSEVIGEATDLSSADTINGAKAYAKDYADEAIADLSVDNYIKHGECVQSDLSGFFILDCGGASLRTNEPTA